MLQVGYLVTSCPAILAEKPLELKRKVDFLHQQLNMELNDLAKHPTYLGASLMQVCLWNTLVETLLDNRIVKNLTPQKSSFAFLHG